jgi:hypothetical protein
MNYRDSENGHFTAEPCHQGGSRTEIEALLLHGRLFLQHENRWLELLGLQNEQLRLLASWVEKGRLSSRKLGPDQAPLGTRRNARERVVRELDGRSSVAS